MNVKGNLSIEDYLLEARPPRNLIFSSKNSPKLTKNSHGVPKGSGAKMGLKG
jgi:hypothetical protein